MQGVLQMNAIAQIEPRELPLGRAARALWTLRPDASLLNHGSRGAVPRMVQQEQQRLRALMESHPDAFFARIEPVGTERAPRHVADSVAQLAGTSGDRLALVENATTGVQAVLNSLPFGQRDSILFTDQLYNAVRLAIEARCRESGATPAMVRLPLPLDDDTVVERVLEAAGPNVKLVVLDHITSGTAARFPLERIAPELRRRGIPLFIDGAHAVGQMPLDLDTLGVDWYVSNLHKWAYAPRGSAFLYAAPGAASLTRPALVSHYIDMGFPHSFDYTGTRDYTAWLAVPAALDFFAQLGVQRVREYNSQLVRAGSAALERIGAESAAPRAPDLAMRAFVLPQQRPATDADAETVMRMLWDEARIQIRCARIGGKLLLRFCAQAYVEADEITALATALDRLGWPARS
jgi:isopenicillin-N epimerase